ncbi:sigma-70 family RNA polymerase sigma factor [Aestuariimicrobium sp. Y1814]|uniref:sigma-70 family RNA polymerase sigma factor n=1 Tax=Aestuariimicrobium sp. Y1814 TaxID=3418742 RepID=UPI003DA714A8
MDDQAYAELVETEQARLLATAWLLTGDREQARDLVQETLIRGYVKRRLVGRATSPRAYVRAIMLNLWRGTRRRSEYPTADIPEQGSEDEIHPDRQLMVRVLEQLTRRQREVLALRYLDDFSIRDTAAVLGCSEQSVTTETSRALGRLRSHPLLRLLQEES